MATTCLGTSYFQFEVLCAFRISKDYLEFIELQNDKELWDGLGIKVWINCATSAAFLASLFFSHPSIVCSTCAACQRLPSQPCHWMVRWNEVLGIENGHSCRIVLQRICKGSIETWMSLVKNKSPLRQHCESIEMCVSPRCQMQRWSWGKRPAYTASYGNYSHESVHISCIYTYIHMYDVDKLYTCILSIYAINWYHICAVFKWFRA